ncbi:MAG TPA: hypothetical protein VIU39_08055 [Anaerolineales bacterium]
MIAKRINGAVRIPSLLVLVLAAGCSRLFQKADVEASVGGVLAAYGNDLSSGMPSRGSLYSRQMKAPLTDVIEWQAGRFTRKLPDYGSYPDYSMYHMSIEEVGQSLLEDYSK